MCPVLPQLAIANLFVFRRRTQKHIRQMRTAYEKQRDTLIECDKTYLPNDTKGFRLP